MRVTDRVLVVDGVGVFVLDGVSPAVKVVVGVCVGVGVWLPVIVDESDATDVRVLDKDAKLLRDTVEVLEELILPVGLLVPVDVGDSRAEEVALTESADDFVVEADGLGERDGSSDGVGSAVAVELNEVRDVLDSDRLEIAVNVGASVLETVAVLETVRDPTLETDAVFVDVLETVILELADMLVVDVTETDSSEVADGLIVELTENVSAALAETD